MALASQMRTEELRDLLERFPELTRSEKRRLRRLYEDASATDLLAIMASSELASKARRLEVSGVVAGNWPIIVLALLAFAVGLGLLLSFAR
jgi:hypothetical protein